MSAVDEALGEQLLAVVEGDRTAPRDPFFRDLTAGGFYTTPAGTKDLRYVGNVALERFDGPPPEVLAMVGLMAVSK